MGSAADIGGFAVGCTGTDANPEIGVPRERLVNALFMLIRAYTDADFESLRAMHAVKREFPDPKEYLSLSLRLRRFTEIVSDKKLLKWGMVKHSEGGLEVHDAVVNALAAAPIRKSGVLDKDVFHELVKAEYTRLEAAEKA